MTVSLGHLAILPVVYIAAITAISRGEVHGGSRNVGWMAVTLAGGVVAALIGLDLQPAFRLSQALFFVALFAGLVLPAFVRAARSPQPALIKRAVRAGILGLIPLNAALAAGFAGWPMGVTVLLLLPISIGMARLFAVT
jgi:4-hydroxybenzoate polyprenyltransferase